MHEGFPGGIISIIIILIAAFKYKLRKEKSEREKPNKESMELLLFESLRINALRFKKSETNLTDDNPLYGLVVDINNGEEIITLFTIREGSIEIYFSNGGYIFLEREDNLIAAMETVENFKIAESVYKKAIKTDQTELPSIYSTNFFFLTTDGRRIIIEDMQYIVENVSIIYELFDRANRIIREVLEKIERDSDDEFLF
ncbi:MAG: hypothetical protein KDC55_08635 [Ignavibacteriae bacterium]|nr:hypothetical protein [Ignavibacteriota bacterium]MCB9220396.1 hypothetical protein [Ignavibacteria bacterium]